MQTIGQEEVAAGGIEWLSALTPALDDGHIAS